MLCYAIHTNTSWQYSTVMRVKCKHMEGRGYVYLGMLRVNRVITCTSNDLLLCYSSYKKQRSLSIFERKHNVRNTWKENDAKFVAAKKRLHEKMGCIMLGKLHVLSAERMFLLEIKKSMQVLNYYEIEVQHCTGIL